MRRHWTVEWECRTRLTYRKREQSNRSRCIQVFGVGRSKEEAEMSWQASRLAHELLVHGYIETQAGWRHQDSIMVVVKLQALEWGSRYSNYLYWGPSYSHISTEDDSCEILECLAITSYVLLPGVQNSRYNRFASRKSDKTL